MRLLRFILGLFLVLPTGLALAGCEDPNAFRMDPVLVTDTVPLATPTSEARLPTALDIVSTNAVIGGGRFPERVADAGQWDFAVRVRGGDLVLVPAGAVGFENRPMITRPITDRTFEEVTRAPDRASFVTDSAVVMQEGSVYVARSRQFAGLFGGVCFQYAKLQPLSVNVAEGTLRVQLTTNERCQDPRLVP